MASFAPFQQQPMASTPQDFTLYSNYWDSDRPFISEPMYNDNGLMGYTTTEAYTHAIPNPYALGPDSFEQQYEPQYNSPAKADFSYDYQPPVLSAPTSDSGASHSAMSSNMGSPSAQAQQANEWNPQINMFPSIVQNEHGLQTSGMDIGSLPVLDNSKGCVDPSLIQPFPQMQVTGAQYPDVPAMPSPHIMAYPGMPSPAPSKTSVHSPRSANGKMQTSPHMYSSSWQPYPAFPGSRRPSVSSVQSRHSHTSSSDESNKGLCPYPTCGRHFKDLKAHMLTHQNERPEKCPIPTCEYHTKGFARKYDKNRHTLTHYKGTMVCGFCPGSGSSAEKSFNRADVFKRHLTSVHGVEQTPPNARRKSPSGNKRSTYNNVRDVSGMCSTCGVTFANAQEFYEHLDDCVLRVVQQAEPSEAINEKLLMSVADDPAVHASMKKMNLPTTVNYDVPASYGGEEDDEEDEEDAAGEIDNDDLRDATYSAHTGRTGNRSTRPRKSSSNSR